MRNLNLLYLLFICIAINLTSCDKDEQDCVNCFTESEGNRSIIILNNKFDFDFWEDIEEQYTTYILEEKFSKLKANFTLTSDNIFEKNIISYIVFTNKFYKTNEIVDLNNILGVQIYFSKGEQMYIDVYKNNDGDFTKINELSSTVKHLSFNDIYACSTIFGNCEKSVFVFLNKEVRTPTNSEESNFNNNIIKYNLDNELNNVNQVRIPDAGSGCKSPCSKTSKGQCSYVNDSPRPSYYKCVRTTVDDCPWSRMSNNENETNIIYELRDQYLAQNSNLGQKYVDYYYFLGSNQNLFTNEIWDELSQIKPLILEKANLFIFGENNKILFDNKDKNEFISVINKLKTINSDIEFQNMLNDVNLDLNFYANKKISEIKNDLN